MIVTAMDLFAAGSETTATTLSWAVLYMILNPEIQVKIHREIDDAIGSREPSLEDRPRWVENWLCLHAFTCIVYFVYIYCYGKGQNVKVDFQYFLKPNTIQCDANRFKLI